MNLEEVKTRTESINPATGEVLGHSPLHTIDDLKKMVKKAREAQKAWGALPVKKRVRYMRAIRNYLVDNSDRLSETIARDNGKLRIDAFATEVLPSAMAISYYAKHAKKFLNDIKLGTGNILFLNKRSKVARVPFGVVGIISPWNYPFTIPFSEVIMGLLSGNAVILKTATETQMVGMALREAIEAAGLPDGIFSYINLPGRIAGDAFLESGIDKLFFTGSVPVGKILMAKASETLTPVNLELGGNDAMLVCDDADISRAATGAVWAGFSNAGQSCGGVERIYVHEKVYEPFLKLLKEKVEGLRVGYDTDYNCDMGCMTTQKQAELVKTHVDDALKHGAKLYARSKTPQNDNLHNFIPAMVLTDVNHEMLVMKDETFGPVVGVMKVSDMDEAIDLANDSYLGLTGSVWCKNHKKAERIARKIKAGAVTINDHLMSHGLAETSWGGFKQSGIGRSHGELGFNEMTQPQMIVNDILPGVKKNMWWHPYNETIYKGIKGVMDVLYGRSIGRRLSGMGRLLRIFPRMFSEKG